MVEKNVKQDSAKQLQIFVGANNYMIINVYLFSSMGVGGGGEHRLMNKSSNAL